MSFAKNMGTYLSNKYSQKFLDSATIIYIRCNKNCFKRVIQKTAEEPGDLIANKIADKIINIFKKSSRELQNNEVNNEIEIPKER